MQSAILRYYSINKTFMSQIGAWPYQSRSMRILIPCVIVFIDISYLIPEMIRMFDTWGNIDIAVECMVSILFVIACFTKLFNLSFRIKKMRYLFSLIKYHWEVFTNSADVEILQDYATFTRKVVIFYATYVYTSTTLFLIIPLSSQILDVIMPLNETRPRRFLFEVEYRIDHEKYYYPILFHSYVAVAIIMSIVVCVDTTYVMYVQHGCSLFAAIGYQLQHITSKGHSKTNYLTKSKERTRENVKVEDIYFKEEAIFREFIMCLRKHQLAIQYTLLLESSFMLSSGIQLSCNMIVLSLIGMQIISNLDKIEELIRYVCLCAGAFFHLMCMTLPGQRLMDHSMNVFDQACRSHWYILSLKSKNLLRILLYRSLVPCTLTAGKIYVMSMANYSMVVQTALSYFMTFSSLT
nr:PREDICTED: uncharacterized protein LOC105677736 [Linepithema humile]